MHITYYAPTNDSVSKVTVRPTERSSPPPPTPMPLWEQTATTSLHQPTYDVEGFDQNCLSKGRGRNTETEDEDNWWHYRGPFQLETTWQGHRPRLLSTIIPVLTRPENYSTCNVGQVIRATLSKLHPWSRRSSAAWSEPSHWAHSTLSSG